MLYDTIYLVVDRNNDNKTVVSFKSRELAINHAKELLTNYALNDILKETNQLNLTRAKNIIDEIDCDSDKNKTLFCYKDYMIEVIMGVTKESIDKEVDLWRI